MTLLTRRHCSTFIARLAMKGPQSPLFIHRKTVMGSENFFKASLVLSFSSWVFNHGLWKTFPFKENHWFFRDFSVLTVVLCSFAMIWKERKNLIFELNPRFFWQLRWFAQVNSKSRPNPLSLIDSWLSLCLRWYWILNSMIPWNLLGINLSVGPTFKKTHFSKMENGFASFFFYR